MPNVSIMVSAKDDFSAAIKSMSTTVKGFSKDTEELQKKLDGLNKNKATLKVQTDGARKELRELEKQFAKTGDVADETNLHIANENYEHLRRNLGVVSKTAKEAEKAIISLNSSTSKLENKSSSNAKMGMVGALAASGATKLVGDMATNMMGAWVSSSTGAEAGTMFNSVLSGMASGAAVGAAFGVPGAIVGGVVGSGLGLINGDAEIKKNKDQVFKGVAQSEYDRVTQQQQNDMMSGSAIASQRETDAIAFEKLLGGKGTADTYLSDIRTMANTTPFLYSDLTAMSKTLAPAFGDDTTMMKDLLTGIGNAGASTGLGVSDMSMVATAMGRMQSTGKTSLEYLNLLQERGIDAYQFVADGKGTSKEAVLEDVSKGNIAGTDAVQYILDGLQKSFAGAMEAQSKTFGGLSSTAEGWQQETQAAMGEGYNEERKKGMQEQVDWISGEHGGKMAEGNKLIGQYKASLENEREQALRDAQTMAMDSAEYQKALAEGNGAEAGRILMEAQVKAENEYKKSEGYQLYLETEKTMVDNLRADLSEGWENYGYSMSQQFTLGLERGKIDRLKQMNPEGIKLTRKNKLFSSMDDDSTNTLSKGNPKIASSYITGGSGIVKEKLYDGKYGYATGGFAFGLSHVPYDNFPALLHQGERVLTASEARTADRGASTPPITITGNQFTVREEADIDRIAAELARKLEKASVIYAN